MKKLLILLFIFSFGLQPKLLSCSCDWGGPFLKVAYDTDLVVIVKIVNYLIFKDIYGKSVPMSMEAEIIEILQGQEDRNTIVIWGNDGGLCRPYLNEFPVGTSWIMALYTSSDEWGQVGKSSDDYEIFICGAYWLRIDGENVEGVITNEELYVEDDTGEFIINNEYIDIYVFKQMFNSYKE
jgi:hypothetical protein